MRENPSNGKACLFDFNSLDYIIASGQLAFTELTWYEVVKGDGTIGARCQLETSEALSSMEVNGEYKKGRGLK